MRKIKMPAVMIMAVLLIASICCVNETAVQAKSNSVKVGKGMYTITSEKKKEARFDRVSKKSVTSLSIPATVKIGKKTYKVTSIKANALKSSKKIQKLTIGKNVKKIGKKAFYGCKNLKSITIKTTKLTMKSVGSKAFAKLNSKLTVKVPQKKLAAYQKLLKAKGVTGKNQMIESSEEKEGEKKVETKDPLAVTDTRFGIGEPDKALAYWDEKWDDVTSETTAYTAGEAVPFSMSVDVPLAAYGHWEAEMKTVDYAMRCYKCGKWFDNQIDYEEHSTQDGAGHGHYEGTRGTTTQLIQTWVHDKTPYSVTFHATLPDGLKYKEGSMKLSYRTEVNIDSSVYTTKVSGQDITVTIDDIKAEPFWTIYRNYSGFGNWHNLTRSFIITFDAEVGEDAARVNTAAGSVTCSNASGNRTFNTGTASVLTAGININNVDSDGKGITGAGFKIYKQKATGLYEQVGSELTGGPAFSFKGLGTGNYKLVQSTTPVGYQRMSNFIFSITAENKGTSYTRLAAVDENGDIIVPHGGEWSCNLAGATLTSNVVNEIDPKQTKEITATVQYSYGGEINSMDTVTLQRTVSVLEVDAKIPVEDVYEADREGYKLDCITVNGKKVPSLPDKVSDGDVVIYHYVTDGDATKTLSATVRYYQDGNLVFYQQYVREVKYSATTLDTDGISDRAADFSGYRLDKITVDGTKVSYLPKTVDGGSVIAFYYVEDDSAIITLSVTVQYSLEGEIQTEDTCIYTMDVKAAETDGYLKNASLPEKSYPGYKVSKYYINGSKYRLLPASILDGSVVVVYYDYIGE